MGEFNLMDLKKYSAIWNRYFAANGEIFKKMHPPSLSSKKKIYRNIHLTSREKWFPCDYESQHFLYLNFN